MNSTEKSAKTVLALVGQKIKLFLLRIVLYFWRLIVKTLKTVRYAAFFVFRYVRQLVKEWTFWVFLFIDIVGLANVLLGDFLQFSREGYWAAALMCFLIANNEVIRKGEFGTLSKPARKYLGHTYKINALTLSEKGDKFLSSSDRVVILWDARSNQPLKRLQCPTWIIPAVFIEGTSQVIGVGGKGTFFRWDSVAGTEIENRKVLDADAVAMAISPQADRLATAGKDGWITLWDFPQVETQFPLHMATTEVRRLAFSPKSGDLIACDLSGCLSSYKPDTGERNDLFKHPENEPVRDFDISPDGERIVFVDGSGKVYCYFTATQKLLQVRGHDDMGLCCRFNASGDFAATGGQDGRIILWKVGRNRLTRLFSIAAHSGAVTCLAFEKEANNLFSGGLDAKIKYWKLDFLLFK